MQNAGDRVCFRLENLDSTRRRFAQYAISDPHYWAERLRQLDAAETPTCWLCRFALIDWVTNEKIGFCGFKGPADEFGSTEIEYGIEVAHRRRGYGSLAVRHLVDIAKEQNQIVSLTAIVRMSNLASRRVLETNLFVPNPAGKTEDDALMWYRRKLTSG